MLLDTHAFLWWLAGDDALPVVARAAITNDNNEVFISAASAWEIAIKHHLGKLPGVAAIVTKIDRVIASQGFIELPITLTHAQTAGNLPIAHRDPFDRLLIAQAMLESLVFVSNEQLFETFGINRLWDQTEAS